VINQPLSRIFFHGTIDGTLAYLIKAWVAWEAQMKGYSIIKVGNEYVVQAGENSVLKVASRRRAARLVTDATELLASQAAALDRAGSDAAPFPNL
jgi:DNA-binding helix-hairpin-helix protein with protein kinase domain